MKPRTVPNIITKSIKNGSGNMEIPVIVEEPNKYNPTKRNRNTNGKGIEYLKKKYKGRSIKKIITKRSKPKIVTN